MMGSKKGSLTVFFSLFMLVFVSFALVLVEGTRVYYARAQAVQAMEMAEFSVLSEYQKELYDHYGLFFLDLDYEQGSEQIGILEKRAQKYLTQNAEDVSTKDVRAENFSRATDSEGSRFFYQAVEYIKVKSGYRVFEELIGSEAGESVDLGEMLAEKENTANSSKEESLPISLPNISFPSVEHLTESVFGNTQDLSRKEINPKERLLQRDLSKGTGKSFDPSVTETQLFHEYILKYFTYYGNKDAKDWTDSLEYQVEYIVSGRESDRKNLENIMWRIFLLRAGTNYLFCHQDAASLGQAQLQAMSLVGFTGNVVLIEAVTEIFLIAQAIDIGIDETRNLFAGQRVPVYRNGIFEGVEFGYREYLYFFLNTTNQAEKTYRCMDIAEMEIRKQSGYESLRWDHLVDGLTLCWDYSFPSIFSDIPLLNGGIYENNITRKIYYTF